MNLYCFKKIVVAVLFLTLLTSVTYSQPNNTKQATFISLFPDSVLAGFVAQKLGKELIENTTTQELANIRGNFDIGVVPIANLKGIGYLTGIDSFSCYKNDVTEIPSEIGLLRNLKYLDLNKAFSLKKIPKEIGLLKNLKMIRLSLTEVGAIPKEIGDLSELETLWICCNELKSLPKEIGKLKKLTSLDIHSNHLSFVPSELCNLSSLSILDMSHCELKELPENIGNLKNLTTLNLFNNKLRRIPKSISQLKQLSYLNVYDNFNLTEDYKKYLPKSLRNKKAR